MKVEIVKIHRVLPQRKQNPQQTALLPVVDAWYAYRRSLVPIYLFDACQSQEKLTSELLESLSRTLNVFPQLAGTLEPYTIQSEDGKGQSLQRTMVIWGGNELGGEFIEARTSARIQSLLPPPVHNASGFIWDRTGMSLRPLFPITACETSGLRAQVTSFACGGFSLGIDFDHGLADAYTVGLFMRYWSATHNRMFARGASLPPAAALPDIVFSPQLIQGRLPKVEDHQGLDSGLLQKARELPTRRPDLRVLNNKSAKTTKETASKPPPKPPTGVAHLLHVSAREYERITRAIQEEASVQITDQVAFVSFLWAALNRARASSRYPVDLHLSVSFRWTLGLPEGLLGSPSIAVMMNGGKEGEASYVNAAKLAAEITETLDKYDEDALLAVVYDASFRDSPTRTFRPAEREERMEFTSGVQFGSSKMSFGSNKPVFFGPLLLPADNLFLMVEGLRTSAGVSSKWYKDGANVFFSVPEDVLEALMADPAFAGLEKLSAT